MPLRGVEDEEDIGVPLAAERGVDSEPPEPMEGQRYLLGRPGLRLRSDTDVGTSACVRVFRVFPPPLQALLDSSCT